MKTSTLIKSLAICLPLLGSLASCGKSKSSDESATTTMDPTTAAVSSGFAEEGVAALVGQLQISTGLRLASAAVKLYAFPLVGGKLPGKNDMMEIEVAEDGSFEAKLPKVPPLLDALKKAKNADGTYDRSKITDIIGENVDDSVTDAMITEYLDEMEAEVKTKGVSWALVTVEETGDAIADAETMKFISIGTAGNSISAIPTNKVKGDLSLGAITLGSSSEVYTDLDASEVFDLSSDVLSGMAKLNDTTKAIKNVYINGDTFEPTPFYMWYLPNLSNLDDFTAPETIAAKYNGSGFYLGVSLPDLTFNNVCGTSAKLVELYPASGELDAGVYGKITPTRPFNNSNRSAIQSESSRYNCGGSDTGFYAASRNDDSDYLTQTDLMMNWGAGGSITGAITEGLWKFKVDGVTKGAFDFASSAPFGADGTPKVFIPSVKLVKDADGNITDAQVKIYAKTADGWVALSDLTQFKETVGAFMMEFENRGNDNSTTGNAFNLFKDGTTTAGVVTHDLSKAGGHGEEETAYTWKGFGSTASGDTKVLTGVAVYYEIFGSSYRVEFRGETDQSASPQ
ncbi:MAG TPA: hypothetical protein VE954_28490 [Oligoflexus sp.]|uniref:hypothetical protein n=1 Tax=Oligoflexus sp. TaxID=1971216 RepID=UPI002D728413|nr:hypothetical protein [Oligoflexus sp.]HYX37059.1 hypothetical protein [Oligoflexus sp.]